MGKKRNEEKEWLSTDLYSHSGKIVVGGGLGVRVIGVM